MKVAINIIKFIIITILTISLICIGTITIISSTILDQSYITQKLEETNFYGETYELAKSNFENYIYQSGLDEEVLENICTQEKVKQDVNIILSNIYEGTEKEIDTTEIANNLNQNIDKLGIKNSKNQNAIEEFVKHICEEYKDTIIHTKYESKINNEFSKVAKLLDKIYGIAFIGLVVSIILIIIINIKKVSKNIQNIGTALLATSIFQLISCNIIVKKVNIEGIKIFNDTFSKAIVAIIKEVIAKMKSLSVGILVIGIICILIYAIITFIRSDKTKEEIKQ